MKNELKIALTLTALLAPTPAFAYMGVGAGLSAMGSILSFFGVMLLMAFGFVWYPVKRMLKKARAKNAEPGTKETGED